MSDYEMYTEEKLPRGWSRFVPGHNGYTQGKGFRSPEFTSYYAMLKRCYYSLAAGYDNYGGRGVKVCIRWILGEGNLSGFECFLLDMGNRPEGTSINRIDNNLGYSPSNCNWVSAAEQSIVRSIQKRNSSGYRGTSALGGRWRADITVNNKNKYLGLFGTAEEAAAAYNVAALECRGDLAQLNHIPGHPIWGINNV